jgi:uncharacterized membrane protein
MTDVTPPPTPPPAANAPLSDERQMALIVYLAYLGSLAFPPLSIAGLVLAYVNRDTAPDWLKTHHTFQIRTFWICLLYSVISLFLCIVLIGFPLLLGVTVLFIARCALGINRLLLREAYPNPESWIT